MSDREKYRDHPALAPKSSSDDQWGKPLLLDDRSLPSRAETERFNVAGDHEDPSCSPRAGRHATTRPRWQSALLLGVLSLVALAGVSAVLRPMMRAGSLPFDVNHPASAESSTSADSSTAPPPLMAHAVSDGALKFQVLAVTTDVGTVVTNGGAVPAEGGFLVVDLKVTNTDSVPHDFDPLAQQVITSAGRQYGPRIEAQRLYSGNDMVTALAPGGETQVRLAFDIPNGEVPSMFYMHAVKDSYGTTVALS